MSDHGSTSVPPLDSDHVQIAQTGRIPETWVIAIHHHAVAVARRARVPTNVLVRDLESVGRTALWRAAVTFDPERGTPFEHYARRAIFNEMLTEVRFVDHRTAATVGDSFDDPEATIAWTEDPADAPIPPDEEYESSERGEYVRDWIATCPVRLQEVFVWVYEEGLTQVEAAEAMGISQPRVWHYNRQLLDLGRRNLAHAMAA